MRVQIVIVIDFFVLELQGAGCFVTKRRDVAMEHKLFLLLLVLIYGTKKMIHKRISLILHRPSTIYETGVSYYYDFL